MSFESLLEWNPWWETGKVPEELKGIERSAAKKPIDALGLRQVKIIAGVRRCGKSTILYQIIDHLIKGGIDSRSILYINFEDENLISLDFDKIMEIYREKFDVDGIFLFVDEIQNRPRWEFWIKTNYDLRKFRQIFVSGSSSLLLASEYATLLTGRELTFVETPLSFKEFLDFRNIGAKLISKEKKAAIKRHLEEYLQHGGFPEVVLEKVKKHQILSSYYSAILEKDVIYRYKLEADKVKMLAKHLLTNISRPHSYRSLANIAGLSTTTVSHYLGCLENAFIIYQVHIFSYKVKDQLYYPRKIYCVDNGLRNVVSFRFSEDMGHLYENAVFMELKRRNKEVFYWKGKGEVDFVVKHGLNVQQLIQVCRNVNYQGTKKRELKSLVAAAEELKCNDLLVITEDYEAEEAFGDKKIVFIPLWKWMLNGKR